MRVPLAFETITELRLVNGLDDIVGIGRWSCATAETASSAGAAVRGWARRIRRSGAALQTESAAIVEFGPLVRRQDGANA